MGARRKAHTLTYVDRAGKEEYDLLGLAENDGLGLIPQPERAVLAVLMQYAMDELAKAGEPAEVDIAGAVER